MSNPTDVVQTDDQTWLTRQWREVEQQAQREQQAQAAAQAAREKAKSASPTVEVTLRRVQATDTLLRRIPYGLD